MNTRTRWSTVRPLLVVIITLPACSGVAAGSLADCREPALPVAANVPFRSLPLDPPVHVEPLSETGYGEVRSLIGDVDSDGVVDFVFRYFSMQEHRTEATIYHDAGDRMVRVPSADHLARALAVADVDGDGFDDVVASEGIYWGRPPNTTQDFSAHAFAREAAAFTDGLGARYIASTEADCFSKKPFRLARVVSRDVTDASSDLPDAPPINVQSFSHGRAGGKDVVSAAGWACRQDGSNGRVPFLFEKGAGPHWHAVTYETLGVEWGAPMGTLFEVEEDRVTVTFDPEVQVFRLSDWSRLDAPILRLCHSRPYQETTMIPWGIARVAGLTLVASGADDPYDAGRRGVIAGISSVRAFTTWGGGMAEVPTGDMTHVRGDWRWISTDGDIVVVTAIAGGPAVFRLAR